MLKTILTLACLAVLGASAPTKNIVQLAQSVPDLSTLVTALTAGELTTTLSGKGPFTVFAPTNEAFAKLPAATLAHLLDPKNIRELQAVLEYHVISGAAVFAKDLKTFQMVKTVEGDEVKIVKAGSRVIVNKATVTAADNAASNGVVHIIDGVLIPPTKPTPAPTPGPPTMNIVQLAQSVPDLSTLVTALVAGKLTDVLSGPGPFTVFAPTNEAFAKLPSATLTRLLDPKNIKELNDVLEYHVLAGASPFTALAKGGPSNTYKTVEGAAIDVTRFCTDRKCGRSKVGINVNTTVKAYPFEAVVRSDAVASNGVVHIIDNVLIPPVFPSANHLFFRNVNSKQQCGEVDAAPRMPASLFEPHNAAALKRYTDITLKLYGITTGVKDLKVGQCKDAGFTAVRARRVFSPWAPSNLMNPICAQQCHCTFASAALVNSTLLPACKDEPDHPSAGQWCSLCGPKYNQPIAVNLFSSF
jgi:uncharacterized surface protein with fasciclin (FAS1) repeats